ncbi:hypothetical protein T439DRAFT_330434 [Meredithblackwellia eburnea MCA 4105]
MPVRPVLGSTNATVLRILNHLPPQTEVPATKQEWVAAKELYDSCQLAQDTQSATRVNDLYESYKYQADTFLSTRGVPNADAPDLQLAHVIQGITNLTKLVTRWDDRLAAIEASGVATNNALTQTNNTVIGMNQRVTGIEQSVQMIEQRVTASELSDRRLRKSTRKIKRTVETGFADERKNLLSSEQRTLARAFNSKGLLLNQTSIMPLPNIAGNTVPDYINADGQPLTEFGDLSHIDDLDREALNAWLEFYEIEADEDDTEEQLKMKLKNFHYVP